MVQTGRICGKYSQVSCQIAALHAMESIQLLARYYQAVIKNLSLQSPIKPGDILAARVHSKQDASHYQLQIRGQLIAAESKQPLQTGDRLQLQVTRTTNPITLKILPPSIPAVFSKAVSLEQARNQILKQDLPKQQPVGDVMRKLSTGFPNTTENLRAYPEAVTKSLHALRLVIESYGKADTPKQLRQAVQASGLFFESKLLQANQPKTANLPVLDLKSALLNMNKVLGSALSTAVSASAAAKVTPPPSATSKPSHVTPAKILANTATVISETGTQQQASANQATARLPGINAGTAFTATPSPVLTPVTGQSNTSNRKTPVVLQSGSETRLPGMVELKSLVEAALSRLQVNQSQAVISESYAQPVWSAEIPLLDKKDMHTLALNVYQDGHKQNNECEGSWVAQLELDLDRLGTMTAKVMLNRDKITTTLWADSATTAQLIEQKLDYLDRRLHKSGLQVRHLQCLHGTAEPIPRPQTTALVDLQL